MQANVPKIHTEVLKMEIASTSATKLNGYFEIHVYINCTDFCSSLLYTVKPLYGAP